MTDIWLVRHGEAAAHWGESPDPGLSELGRQQAGRIADHLAVRVGSDAALVSSPFTRAVETAAPLAERLGVTVAIAPVFREIQAPVPLVERQHWLRDFMTQTWDDQPDSQWLWRRGIVDALRSLDQPTVIFTHFLVINAVLAHLSGEKPTVQAWPANGSVHHLHRSEDTLALVELGAQMDSVVN